jgi:hypothetical protein
MKKKSAIPAFLVFTCLSGGSNIGPANPAFVLLNPALEGMGR